MNFASDNVATVAPEVLEALAAANTGPATSYGDDPWTERLEHRLAVLFEHEVAVFPISTGSAANALALSAICPPYSVVYCHQGAHIHVDECGAPEFYTGGAKLRPLPGDNGKLASATLAEALAHGGAGDVHQMQPRALSLTECTEAGTVYTPAEIRSLADVAHANGLRVHVDGARFANAIAHLGCTVADITWRVGVDVLSFGGTKNGALAAEAVVFFDRSLAADVGYRRKRAGHLLSKMRYCSAQLDALLTNGLWLRHATHANRLAQRLANGLATIPSARLVYPVQANEVFVTLPEHLIAGLLSDGFQFARWADGGVVRLVTAFNSTATDVDAFLASARRCSATGPRLTSAPAT